MDESILNTIKKMLGLEADYDAFDTDVIHAINTALFTLMQIGVGPDGGFTISGSTETWADFLGDSKDLEAAKSYVYMKTRLAFDPPQNSSVADSLKEMANEYEWRLLVQTDSYHNV